MRFPSIFLAISVVFLMGSIIFAFSQYTSIINARIAWGDTIDINGIWLSPSSPHLAKVEKVEDFSRSRIASATLVALADIPETSSESAVYRLEIAVADSGGLLLNVPLVAPDYRVFTFDPDNPSNLTLYAAELPGFDLAQSLGNGQIISISVASANLASQSDYHFIKKLVINN